MKTKTHFLPKFLLLILALCLAVAVFAACDKKQINFKLNFVVDGEVYATVDTAGSEAISMPQNPSKEGKVFDGWYWDKDTWQKPFTANSLLDTPLSSDMNVYAKWSDANDTQMKGTELRSQTLTIENDKISGSVSNATATFSFSANIEAANGATYVVARDIGCEQTIASKTVSLAIGDNTYYILVTNGSLQKLYTVTVHRSGPIYAVTFDTAGGTEIEAQQVEEGDLATRPDVIPERAGYTFVDWNYDFSAPVTATQIITANWKPITYTITYKLNGGTNAASNPATYTAGSAKITLRAPTRTGYTFKGWTYEGQTTPVLTVTIPRGSTGDKTYTANWQFNATYNITYTLNGGTNAAANPATYTTGSSVTLQQPTRTGYTFKGWTYEGQTTPTLSVIISLGSTGDKTYTANWQANTYTVTFNPNGGTVSLASATATYDADFTLPTPTRTGYTAEWYAGNTRVENGAWKLAADTVLTARWQLNPHTADFGSMAYNVVYVPSEKNTTLLAGMSQTLAARLTALTGRNYTVTDTSHMSADPDTPEILIGKIDARQASVDAYNSIQGTGYTISVSGNKICVVGSDYLCTIWALQVFLDNCITETLTTPIMTIDTVKIDNREMITVADNTGGKMPLVYSADCWERADHADPYFRSSTFDLRSYPVKIAEKVIGTLTARMGAGTYAFSKKNDAAAAAGGEFLIGATSRAAGRSFLADLSGSEYGFFAGGGSVALASWSDIGLYPACEVLFEQLSKEAVFSDGTGTYVAFPDGFKVKGVYSENWVVDFPKPEGANISLYNTMDVGEDCLQFLYRGAGVSADAFDAYKAALLAAGYRVLTENTMAENKFATLINDAAGVMLSVAYDSFAHKDEYDYNANPVFDDDTEDNYDYDLRFQKCLRVISCSTSNPKVAVPGSDILTKPASWTKVTETAVTAIEVVYVGSGYVITLEDGRFIVIDGGASVSGALSSLYTLLCKLYHNIYGREPDATHRIPIAAWIITHSHADHYGAACAFLETYGKSTVRLEYLIGNWPAANEAYLLGNTDNNYMANTGISRILKACPGAQFLKVHTGQTYYFANIKIDVLMTTEDHNPFRVDNSNDTSSVLRFGVYASPTDTAPYTMTWLGDANRQQSRWLCAMYGSDLKTDMVSIGHHGNVGCDIELYDTMKPSVAWFAHNSSVFSTYLSTTANTRPRRVDQALFGKAVAGDVLPVRTYLQYLFFSGNDTGGTDHITLPFVNGRPDFAHAKFTLTGNAITYRTSRNVRDYAYKLY